MPASPIRKLVPFAEGAKKKGVKVYHLNIGQPDIETPKMALDAVRNFDFKVLEYSHSAGNESYRRKLATYYKRNGIYVDYQQIIVTTGGSEAILFGFMSCLDAGDEVIIPEPFYANYNGFAVAANVVVKPLTSYIENGFALPPVSEFEKLITPKTRAIVICNPNNPTGTIFSKHEFDEFYRHVPERVLIILDEAYFEYAKDTPRYPDSMHYRYDNVITLRTFSKIYGLAGVRIGYGFAHETLITNLLKVKLPFEPSTLAQAAGIAALSDKEFLHKSLQLNARGLKFLTDGLREIGLTVVPSEANFVMVVLPDPAQAARLTTDLLQQGIIIRPLAGWGLPNCIRISTGTDEDNQRCVEAIDLLSGSRAAR